MIIEDDAWTALEEAVAAAWPEEACGLLVGPHLEEGVVRRVVPLVNTHATPRSGYAFDEREHVRALRAMECRGEEVRAFFHSHPEGPAELSAADRMGLLLEEEPLFPGVAVLVVATRGAALFEAALFTFDAARPGYVRAPLRRW